MDEQEGQHYFHYPQEEMRRLYEKGEWVKLEKRLSEALGEGNVEAMMLLLFLYSEQRDVEKIRALALKAKQLGFKKWSEDIEHMLKPHDLIVVDILRPRCNSNKVAEKGCEEKIVATTKQRGTLFDYKLCISKQKWKVSVPSNKRLRKLALIQLSPLVNETLLNLLRDVDG